MISLIDPKTSFKGAKKRQKRRGGRDKGQIQGDMLIEAGVAVRYDGGKKTHEWCE